MYAGLAYALQHRGRVVPELTPEEVNVRVPLPDEGYSPAPTPPRQADIAPIKPASMPHVFFYHLPFTGGASNNQWRLRGAHVVIDRMSGVPRGRMLTNVPLRRPTAKRIPSPYGSQVNQIGG